MKKMFLVPLALALLAADGGKIKWESDYKKGLERAKKEGLPLLVTFGADW